MIHARKDYDRFQDPALNDPSLLGCGSNAIAEDEPVILFRAKDWHFLNVLKSYMNMIFADETVSYDFIQAIYRHFILAKEWQEKHGTKSPDMPDVDAAADIVTKIVIHDADRIPKERDVDALAKRIVDVMDETTHITMSGACRNATEEAIAAVLRGEA